MNGDWLTLGAIGALAVAGAARRGSADRSQGDLRHQILQAARKVCAVGGYLNCRLFVQLTSGTASLESIPIVSGPPQIGDVLQWGENPARHWAIFIGNGEVLEVPEWGGGLTTTPLHDVTDEYGPPRPAIRRLVWERGSSQRGSASAVARRSVYKQHKGWTSVPARLTDEHAIENDTLIAKWMARERGQNLGQGNFGVTHLVQTIDGPRVVKVPASQNIHGQPWDLAELRGWFLHEAGVANELTDLGYRIVPRTTFVDKPIDRVLGIAMDREPIPFALVREYGELVTSMTPAEFSKLERDLFDLENESGWYPADELLVLRRQDGSLFIGDVGIWSAPRQGGRQQSVGWDSNMSHLTPRLADQVVSKQAGRAPSMASMLYQIQRLDERDFPEIDGSTGGEWWLAHVEDLRSDAARRRAAGLAIPVEVQAFLAKHESKPQLGRAARRRQTK